MFQWLALILTYYGSFSCAAAAYVHISTAIIDYYAEPGWANQTEYVKFSVTFLNKKNIQNMTLFRQVIHATLNVPTPQPHILKQLSGGVQMEFSYFSSAVCAISFSVVQHVHFWISPGMTIVHVKFHILVFSETFLHPLCLTQ